MAKYHISYELPSETRDEAIARFMEGSALEDPEGATTLGRWHSVGGGRGWAVVEAEDPKAVLDSLLQWTDLIRYDVTPVVEDEELGEILVKQGHGS